MLIYKIDKLKHLFPVVNLVFSSLPFIVCSREINAIPYTNAPSKKKIQINENKKKRYVHDILLHIHKGYMHVLVDVFVN